jgi:trigger factor
MARKKLQTDSEQKAQPSAQEGEVLAADAKPLSPETGANVPAAEEPSMEAANLLEQETAEPALEFDESASAEEFAEQTEAERERLALDVQIEERSACERHIVVTVPREDIERYFQHEFDQLRETAAVPGFRPGRAPRKLIERRFRKEVAESVKVAVVADAIQQVTAEYNLKPIGEPELDVDAVILPEDGPLTFEYDLEVRPTFDLPTWEGITLEVWKVEVSDQEIDQELQRLLESEGTLEPIEEPAKLGDYVVVDLKFSQGERLIAESSGEVIRIRPVLEFLDGEIRGFDTLMVGVKPGDVRQCTVRVSPASPDLTLRGMEVEATFTVREVKRVRLPELTAELLQRWGADSEESLRDRIRQSLLSHKTYLSRQHLRRQITEQLLRGAGWDLPPGLVARQAGREMRRVAYELRSLGASDQEISRALAQMRSDIISKVANSLREHFIFERIAEELNLSVEEDEIHQAIAEMARSRGVSARRVRAELEQQGGLDIVVNMILERKVLDAIIRAANLVETPMPEIPDQSTSVQKSIGSLPEELTQQLDTTQI